MKLRVYKMTTVGVVAIANLMLLTAALSLSNSSGYETRKAGEKAAEWLLWPLRYFLIENISHKGFPVPSPWVAYARFSAFAVGNAYLWGFVIFGMWRWVAMPFRRKGRSTGPSAGGDATPPHASA